MSSDFVDRPALVAAIIADTGKVVLIPGESGAGKSTVLAQAVTVARRERYVSGPHEVMWSDPLSDLLIRALGDVVAEILENQGFARQIGDRLASAFERLIASQGRELVSAVGKELLGFVRSRVGQDAGDALLAAAKALDEASAVSLGARLDRARTKTVREVVVGFVQEVVALADSRPVVLALDRCERLDDANARLLADLAEVLPGGAQIWAAIMSDHDSWTFLAQVEKASVVTIPPLTDEEVTRFLLAHDLESQLTQESRQLTRGNPLALRAYVGLVTSRRSLEDSEQANLVADTLRRVDGLPEDAAAFALRIALLSNPLPDAYMLRFTDGDALSRVMNELASAGLLVSEGPSRWIHERQREIIRDHAEPRALARAANDAAEIVWEYVQETYEPRWLVELAALVAQATDLAGEPPTAFILAASDSELAVIAALIELTEPSARIVDAAALLNYARQTYPTADASELEALRRLDESEILSLQSAGQIAVTVLLLQQLPLAVAVGRIMRTFGRFPIPAIASVATRAVIYPRLGGFLDIRFGVGQPTMGTLAYNTLGLGPPSFAGRPIAAVAKASPSVLLRAAFAGRPIYAAVRFDSPERRDRALDALDGVDVEFLGDRLTVTALASYPTTAVPADRYLHAAERAVGRQLTATLHGGEIRERIDSPLTYAEVADRRLQTRKVLRQLAGATMRAAMELDVPSGLHWSVLDGFYLEVEVQGGREIAIGHEDLPSEAWQAGPYQSVHLTESLGLESGESIRRMTTSGSLPEYARTNYDPVLVEVGVRRQLAIAFNRLQYQLGIELNDALVEMIRESFFREIADARVLAARLPIDGIKGRTIPPTTRYVAIPREPPLTGWVPGARSTLIWAERPSETTNDECHVIIVDGMTRDTGIEGASHYQVDESQLKALPGFDPSQLQVHCRMTTMYGIAHLLSHQLEDLDFLIGVRRELGSG